MTLCTDNLQAAKFRHTFTKLNICTTSGHVGCNRNRTTLSGIRNNLSLQFVELRIQYLVLDTTLCKHTAKFLRCFNRNRTNQHRLSFIVCFRNRLYNCIQLFLLRLKYRIMMIDSLYRQVCRNNDNIHTVNLTELFFLCKGCTGHTCLLLIFVKEVLEGNRCQCTALPFYLYIFLCFNRLMQAIRKTPSRHDTSGKLINDQYLIILYNVILIAEHQIMCSQSKDHIMLDLKVLCICKVIDLEELLNLFHTFLCQVDNFVLLVDNKVSCLFLFNTHDGIHLGVLRHILTTF